MNVFFDSLLVGRKLGEPGIAAVNQSLVIYLILCTVGALTASGAMTIAAQAIGRRDYWEAKKVFAYTIELSLLTGLVIAIIGGILTVPIASALSTPDTAGLVADYIRITFYGAALKILSYIPVYFLRLEGKYRHIVFLTFLMVGTNIFLDYVFLFLLSMGTKGAAFASVLATLLTVVLGFIFLSVGKDRMFSIQPVLPDATLVVRLLKVGTPMALNNLFAAVRLIILTSVMNQVGGSTLAAVFGITNSINELSLCVQSGIPQTGMTMLGISAGEKDTSSIRFIQRLQIVYGAAASVIFAVLLTALSEVMNRVFGTSKSLVRPLTLLAISIIPATMNSVMIYYYFALKRTMMANLVTFFHVVGMPVIAVFLFLKMPEEIFIFYPLSECMTFLFWFVVDMARQRKNRELSVFYLLDEHLEKEGKSVSFNVLSDKAAICEASERIQEFCKNNGFSRKQQNAISLSLEEIMVIISEKSLHWQGSMDVRVLKENEGGILRFRADGDCCNPLELEDDENMENLGIVMIKGLAKRVDYQSALGLNTLIVEV